jgi:putative membrane protein
MAAELRKLLYYIFLFIKGVCIGATGVLQGVSGASMALLLGVHHEFVVSFRAVDRKMFSLLRRKKFSIVWERINGNFLLATLAGIATGLITMRPIFNYYVAQYPIFISSFFFSLVIIAALLLLRKITRWHAGIVLCLLGGLIFSYFITRAAPFTTPDNIFTALMSGFFAASTFMIPGVSGSFILMFIGKYQYILTSFGSLEFGVIVIFIAGGLLGMAVFSRLVARLLSDYFNQTVALFAGLMIGSLNKIWPWREVYEYATTIEGKRIPAFDNSILPWRYLEITGKDPQVFYAILMMALGVFMVVLVEKIAARLNTRS